MMEASLSFFTLYPNFNLEEFLVERELEWRVSDSGDHKEYQINCPKCHERGEPTLDTNKKLWINAESAAFHCYRCKWSGSLLKLVQTICKTTLEQAIRFLKGKLNDPMDMMSLTISWPRYKPDESEEDPLRDVELPYGYMPIEGPNSYLEKRLIPWKYAARSDWGTCDAGFCKDRIIIPYFMNNRLVFWQARATWEDPGNKDFKKVLNPKGVSARSVLYNYDVAKNYETVVLAEGFIDATKIGPHAMATNGKKLHPEQCEFLKEAKIKEIILAWDSDAWIDSRRRKDGHLIKPCSMQNAVDLLRGYGFKVRCAKLPEKRDPGSFAYKSEELSEIIARAKDPVF